MKLRIPRLFGRQSATSAAEAPLAVPGLVPAFDLSPQTEACRFIVEYWRSLRGARLRPRNGEIDPAVLTRYLPHVALFEVRTPDNTYCRLAGTSVRLSLGLELTGKNVVHLYAPELHRAAGYRFWSMAMHPCGALFEMPLRFATGVDAPHEVVLLPLEPDKAGAPPLLLVGAAGRNPVNWENMAVLPQLTASPTFRFVDIGAGVPASTLPS